MASISRDERGFGHLEILLLVVVAGIIGFVGWYVYHSKQKSDTALNAASSTSQAQGPSFSSKKQTAANNSGDASNASLQKDIDSASQATSQSGQGINASTSDINDKSTLTTVPQ